MLPGALVIVSETGSTNADLASRLHGGETIGEGHWLIADRQTAGRGRQGRTWFDGGGNFMGSTVVYPAAGEPPAHTLALVIGIAVHRAVRRFLTEHSGLQLKWPNDLMIDQAKLAGVLLEGAGGAVVIGVGVNLAVAPVVEGRQTIALGNLGCEVDRNLFAATLADTFAAALGDWRRDGLAAVIAQWSALAHPHGTPLHVGEPGEAPLAGTFAGLDDGGALLLQVPEGTTRTIHAGEVRLAPVMS